MANSQTHFQASETELNNRIEQIKHDKELVTLKHGFKMEELAYERENSRLDYEQQRQLIEEKAKSIQKSRESFVKRF